MTRLLVWGAGELGGRVLAGWDGPALALTRGTSRHDALGRVAEVACCEPPSAPTLRADDVLLLALAGHVAQGAAVDALRGQPAPGRAVLISSTGVHAGLTGRVGPDSPCGAGPRAGAAAEVERRFRDWAGEAGVVLRCGGLYRPGRGPFSAFVRRGAPPPGPAEKTLALVHYDDAAAATLAALRHPGPARTYLVVTPPCPSRRAFYEAACEALGLPAPVFEDGGGGLAMHDVDLLRLDLIPEPRYPDWRAALA